MQLAAVQMQATVTSLAMPERVVTVAMKRKSWLQVKAQLTMR
jgi:hypothetical protein